MATFILKTIPKFDVPVTLTDGKSKFVIRLAVSGNTLFVDKKIMKADEYLY